MSEWWNNLALRDKQMLSLGSVVVVLFLFYEMIWAPLTGKVDTLRSQVQHSRDLLAWMKETDGRISELAKTSHGKSGTIKTSVLGTVQSEVNESPLAQHVSQLRQAESDSVQLTLQKVDFDQLITWLMELSQKYNLIVTQITVTPADTPGVVGADLILKSQ